MRISEIEKKARGLGIRDTWKYSKKELIKQIQSKENYKKGKIPVGLAVVFFS